MLKIGGEPLLEIWLAGLARAGVDEVLVNLHFLPEVVRHHLRGRTAPPTVRTFFEATLLGSAGTMVANRRWVEDQDMFLVCYADNLTDFDLRSLIEHHRAGGAVATLTVFHAEHPTACGIVELDQAGWMVSFTEKPSIPASNLANAGMYAFHPSVLDEVEGRPPRTSAITCCHVSSDGRGQSGSKGTCATSAPRRHSG